MIRCPKSVSPCGLNQDVNRAVYLLGGSRGESVFLSFPAARGYLPPSICKSITPSLASVLTSPFSDFDPLASSCKNPVHWAHLDNLQYPSPFKVYNLVHLSSPSCHIMHSQVPGIMKSSLRGQSVYPRYLVHFVTWVKKCNKLANITISIKNMTSGKISARGTGFHSLFRHYSQIFFWMMDVLLLFVPAQYLNFLQKESK